MMTPVFVMLVIALSIAAGAPVAVDDECESLKPDCKYPYSVSIVY